LLVDITRNGGGTNRVEAAARTLTGVPLHGARAAFIRHPHYVEIRHVPRESITSESRQRARYGPALALLREQRREASKPCDRSSIWDGKERNAATVAVVFEDRIQPVILKPAHPRGIAHVEPTESRGPRQDQIENLNERRAFR
jgi:hypothetical protein